MLVWGFDQQASQRIIVHTCTIVEEHRLIVIRGTAEGVLSVSLCWETTLQLRLGEKRKILCALQALEIIDIQRGSDLRTYDFKSSTVLHQVRY